MNVKPKVTMISLHCCIRVVKEAIALKNHGYEVHGILGALAMRDVFDTITIFTDGDSLQKAVKDSNADIFHVHNEPDWIVPLIKYPAKKKPIIWDMHDPEHLRDNNPKPEETTSVMLADGIVHVSEPCMKALHKAYEYNKPECVIHSMVNEKFMPPDNAIIPDPSFKSIVYEGGIDDTEKPVIIGEDPSGSDKTLARVNLRYIIDIVKAFCVSGYNFTILCAKNLKNNNYQNAGAFVVKPVPYGQMLLGLRSHGLGLNGSPYNSRLLQYASPNKLWEYISQGVVPVCFNTDESFRLCEQYDIGLKLTSLNNIESQLTEAPQKRKNLLKVRKEFTMESEIPKLMRLYEKVLSNEKT